MPYPRDQYDEQARADFVELAAMLSRASAFSLRRPLVPHIDDIFNLQSGVFVIHCAVTHKEDYDWEFAETVPHYIVYNAGTRVLFLYPEVVVVMDDDLRDLSRLFAKLKKPPYCIRMPSRGLWWCWRP